MGYPNVLEKFNEYLPLSGGTMTGCVYNAAGYYSFTNNSTHKELIMGGYDGGRIAIRSSDSPNSADCGNVVITAVDKTSLEEKHFVVMPDGKMWYDNCRVICEKYYSNERNGWAYYSNGLAYIWGCSQFPSGVYQNWITFPYPLVDTYYNVFGSAYTSVADVIAMGADLQTTGFLFCCRRSYDLEYYFDIWASYLIIGRWK
jgi:hypothetical protein